MIKIPKSLTELKSMITDANLGDALTKVQAQINVASSTVQAAASAVAPRTALVEGELGDIIDQLKKIQEQELLLLKRLAELTHAFQKQIEASKTVAEEAVLAKATPTAEVPEPLEQEVPAPLTPSDTEVTPTTSASEITSEKDATS